MTDTLETYLEEPGPVLYSSQTSNSDYGYDILPSFPVPPNQITSGYEHLGEIISTALSEGQRRIIIDGFGGVLWKTLYQKLSQHLEQKGIDLKWFCTEDYYLPAVELESLIAPNLGADDPLFGRLYEGQLADFFDFSSLSRSLSELKAETEAKAAIVYGPGAALLDADGFLIYVDVPKDEIQSRLRTGLVSNLGNPQSSYYKRLYFIDWPVLNRHKASLVDQLDWLVDQSMSDKPRLMQGLHLRNALDRMARNYFRVRPWFYPAPWGGQFMKQHFANLPQDKPNYGWSFELIAPENGLLFKSGEEYLECSFDWLMFRAYWQVLGRAAARFGYDFPIRFDYLDTMDGGNLSIQCHPRTEYIQTHFGEAFTQDESYYITKCQPGAKVYLGFRQGVEPDRFKEAIDYSRQQKAQIEVEQFVNTVESHQHDLFLIPAGTIHGSGENNLTLEISATPYIYTFKIYDWLRPDLNGKFRPLNVERAWDNLDFERQEEWVNQNLYHKPRLIREGQGWQEFFLGTHEKIFYAVHRYEFTQEITAYTDGRCHILNLVEGEGVVLETANGEQARFNFGETFVIPANAETYHLRPVGQQLCKVVLAFVK